MNPPAELIDDLRLLEAPQPWPFGSWLAALLVAGALVWWLLRRHRARRAAQASIAAATEAEEDALAALERLFALVEDAQSRPYAIESSAIIRRYLERRFELAAPLRSTEEFLAEAQHSPRLRADYQTLLSEFLACCDLLKFARRFADRDELASLHAAAVRFVQETALRRPEAAA